MGLVISPSQKLGVQGALFGLSFGAIAAAFAKFEADLPWPWTIVVFTVVASVTGVAFAVRLRQGKYADFSSDFIGTLKRRGLIPIIILYIAAAAASAILSGRREVAFLFGLIAVTAGFLILRRLWR